MPKTTYTEDDPQLFFYPQKGLPDDGQTVVRSRWWIEHPEKGLVVWRGFSPQCNSNKILVERLSEMYPWAKVNYYEIAFVHIQGDD